MKRAFTLVEVIIVVALLAILVAFLWPVFARARDNARRSSCQSNLKQIGLGFMQYVRDYDEKFPPARVTTKVGWADVLQPYIKSTQLFHCPSAELTPGSFTTDYFYNRRFARMNMTINQTPALTIMAGDGTAGAVTWISWASLPADARTNRQSPAWRHVEVANYLFGDGHVKHYNISQLGVDDKSPSLAIR